MGHTLPLSVITLLVTAGVLMLTQANQYLAQQGSLRLSIAGSIVSNVVDFLL